MKNSGIFLLLLLCWSGSASAYSTQNVFILIIDGPRYTETFGDSGHNHIPKLWNQLRPLGTLFTRYYNDTMTETVPGHSSIVTGAWQVIANDGVERPHLPTMFEYFRKGRNTTANENYVILGKNHLEVLSYSDDSRYGAGFGASAIKPSGTSEWQDTITLKNLKSVVASAHPRLALANLPQVDVKGHAKDSLGYLKAIEAADSIVFSTWSLLQSDAFYKDKTTLIVTCDHGRHTHDYSDHRGDGCDGCRHCILFIIGPDTKAGIVDTTRCRQIDVAPTVGRLLGFSLPYATGRVIESACPPLAPLQASPSDNASNLGLGPIVAWNRTSGGASYRVQVSAAADFSSAILDSASLVDTAIAIDGLAFETRYYWRVRAEGPGGIGDWSPPRSFTTVIAPPEAPTPALPPNDTINQSLSPVLGWGAVPRAASYEIQIAADALFSGPAVFAGNATTADYHAGGLDHNTLYWWRVRAKNAGGTSGWSVAWKFITRPGEQSIPRLLAPADKAGDQPRGLTLFWSPGSGALSYAVQVSRRPDFTGLDTAASGITDTFFSLAGLACDSTYYWRVNATTRGGVTEWSHERRFTTIPAAPDAPRPVAPADSAVSQPLAPKLSWEPAARATAFSVQIGRDAAFSDTLVRPSMTSALCCTVSGCQINTAYWWRVRAMNAGGAGEWSQARKFTTLPGDSARPALVFPGNGATQMPLSDTLRWRANKFALSYGIQIAKDPEFSSILLGKTGICDTLIALPGLSNDTAYYWHVNTTARGGLSDWSDTWKFTTIIAAPRLAPACIAPSDNASKVPVRATLVWMRAAGASSYRVQVAPDSLFASPLRDTGGITDTSYGTTGLGNDASYFWRVIAMNPGGESVWSPAMRFTTVVALPQAPHPISPTDGCGLGSDSLRLIWGKASPRVSRYWVEIASDSAMTSAMVDSADADTLKPLAHLKNNTVFWWRVKACNEAGWGEFCAVQRFKVAVAGVLPARYSVGKFSMSRNLGKIDFQLPEACDVRVRLFDPAGKLVRSIAYENLPPGCHTRRLPVHALPIGNYLVKFTAGRFMKHFKMTVVY